MSNRQLSHQTKLKYERINRDKNKIDSTTKDNTIKIIKETLLKNDLGKDKAEVHLDMINGLDSCIITDIPYKI